MNTPDFTETHIIHIILNSNYCKIAQRTVFAHEWEYLPGFLFKENEYLLFERSLWSRNKSFNKKNKKAKQTKTSPSAQKECFALALPPPLFYSLSLPFFLLEALHSFYWTYWNAKPTSLLLYFVAITKQNKGYLYTSIIPQQSEKWKCILND